MQKKFAQGVQFNQLDGQEMQNKPDQLAFQELTLPSILIMAARRDDSLQTAKTWLEQVCGL